MNILKSILGGGILLSLLAVVSCHKNDNPEYDKDNFVNISVSDVSDGHFTVNFECSENTAAIEYAVCYAVNMKADSAAFAEGKLDNIVRITPSQDGKASVPFDFSEPLDFGPYTVYARAVSESGQASRFVKEQVCALTTGVTVEYVSRTSYRLKTSYHGDEYITNLFRSSAKNILEYYESLEGFAAYMRESCSNDFSYSFDDGTETNITFFEYLGNNQSGGTSIAEDDQLIGFVTTDGTEITGVHIFEIPLQEYDPSIPLPDSLSFDFDFTKLLSRDVEYNDCTFHHEYFQGNLQIGNNTDRYKFFIFGMGEDEFMEFFRRDIVPLYPGWTEEEILEFYIASNYYYQGDNGYYDSERTLPIEYIFYEDIEDKITGEHNESYLPYCLYVLCSVNWNGDAVVYLKEVHVPDEYLEGIELPADAPAAKSPGLKAASLKDEVGLRVVLP